MGRWLSFSDLAAWRISSETRVSNYEYIDLEIIAASMFLCLDKIKNFQIPGDTSSIPRALLTLTNASVSEIMPPDCWIGWSSIKNISLANSL